MDKLVEIPWQKLSTEALQGLLEELVTRDGTDYGVTELPTDTKVAQLRRALEAGTACIAYSPESESWSVLPR